MQQSHQITSFSRSILKLGLPVLWEKDEDNPGIYLQGNPLVSPPPEVVGKGNAAIANYFKELGLGQETIYEAKLLIVGEAGAGKTSLCKKIIDPDYPLKHDEPPTEGIKIHKVRFPIDSADNRFFQMNLWDFGGQEIYHATHKFFLTKRSLYILLEDTRAEDINFNYWLQTIELLSDNSPVIIIQNQKQDRQRELNETGLRSRFNNLLRVMSTNLATNRGLTDVISRIKLEIQSLPHIREKLPKGWAHIRRELEGKSKNTCYLDLNEYLKICHNHGFPKDDPERALFLSDYLHDLGVFLHFQDHPLLKRIIILQPEWGTDAAYKLLDDPEIKKGKMGRFSKKNLEKIWNAPKYSGMHDELLALMMKFELCYPIEGTDDFIAPQLLPANQPDYSWEGKDNLIVRYEYDFMPKGIINRFIVRRHKLIARHNLVWKEGVILERDRAIAEVIEAYDKRAINIRVEGPDRKELLTLIMDELEDIHESYHRLKVDKLIPCNCLECSKRKIPHLFKYAVLRRAREKGRDKILCEESFEEVDILPLIDGYSSKRSMLRRSRVFISYAQPDYEAKEQLLKAIQPLRHNGRIEIWEENQLRAGQTRKAEIRRNLEESDIILFLLSPDLIAQISDNGHEMALIMERAFELRKSGKAEIVPILLRPCLWDHTPFAGLETVTWNTAIRERPDRDQAFVEVARRLEEVINQMFPVSIR